MLRVFRNNSFLIVDVGDFNTKSKGWHNSDKTLKSVRMASQFSLYEVIKKPTDIIGDSLSSFDLIFTT